MIHEVTTKCFSLHAPSGKRAQEHVSMQKENSKDRKRIQKKKEKNL